MLFSHMRCTQKIHTPNIWPTATTQTNFYFLFWESLYNWKVICNGAVRSKMGDDRPPIGIHFTSMQSPNTGHTHTHTRYFYIRMGHFQMKMFIIVDFIYLRYTDDTYLAKLLPSRQFFKRMSWETLWTCKHNYGSTHYIGMWRTSSTIFCGGAITSYYKRTQIGLYL